MGKGRAPCCEKVGLKKGSWTPAEDMILVSYIQKHGHGNWRALPKQAGLQRCGKSCRLRWINYLRPDIKRGNFTKEEEDAIIELHRLLGNKWSKIAARLPGRTDNEIKNVWNTHLKKRLPLYSSRGSPLESHASVSISSASNYNCTTSNNKNGIEKSSHTWNSDEVDESIQASFDHINNVDIHNLPNNMDGWDLAIEEENSSSLPTKHFFPSSSSSSLPPQIDPSEEARIGLQSNEMWIEYLEKELDLWGSSSSEDNKMEQWLNQTLDPPTIDLDIDLAPTCLDMLPSPSFSSF